MNAPLLAPLARLHAAAGAIPVAELAQLYPQPQWQRARCLALAASALPESASVYDVIAAADYLDRGPFEEPDPDGDGGGADPDGDRYEERTYQPTDLR